MGPSARGAGRRDVEDRVQVAGDVPAPGSGTGGRVQNIVVASGAASAWGSRAVPEGTRRAARGGSRRGAGASPRQKCPRGEPWAPADNAEAGQSGQGR